MEARFFVHQVSPLPSPLELGGVAISSSPSEAYVQLIVLRFVNRMFTVLSVESFTKC
jgi:hypothetical protein